jgi:small subunit ribosomal protein S4
MARYTGPVCRLCRREKMKLFLKGPKCDSMKCPIERRPYPPGVHGRDGHMRTKEYELQLREKQKARRIYGLLEKQFRNYFEAAATEPGVTGLNLLRHLELRLDNVIYRIGLGTSRKQARQLVSHRHFEVNGKTVNVPSYQLKVGDVLKVRGSDGVIDVALEASRVRPVPSWLSFSADDKSGKILARPDRHEMETGVEEQLIVEFYSR